MGSRVGLLFVVLLAVSWSYVDARNSVAFDITVTPVDNEMPASNSKLPAALKRNEELCALCEDFTTEAAHFLAENKTQDDIMDVLYQTCFGLHPFEQQCLLLVDYYASLFFKMISTTHPKEFCTKVNLCEGRFFLSLPKNDDTCALCHQAVVDILTKLKDPDTQLEIIKFLLKECKKMEQYAKQCKRLVFQYGPLILVNSEKFLETTDICASVFACSPNEAEAVIKPQVLAEASLAEA